MARLVALLLVFCLSPQAALAQSAPDVENILARVVEAIRTTNYRGRLTYEHSGKLELVEIAHGVIDGVEYEKIDYLNGPDRAIIKNGRSLTCPTYGDKLLSGGLSSLDGNEVAKLEDIYSPRLIGIERIAGRDAWHIQLLPKDDFRHSVILAIDRTTYLPLRSLFIADGRKALERLHFVSLETGVAFEISDFAQSPEEEVPTLPCNQDGEGQISEWRPAWIPPGFVLTGYHYSEQSGHMETYTDGLASFSVFAKPVSLDDKTNFYPVSPTLKKGATVIVMRIQPEPGPMQFSVLGEIPNQTASRILASITAPTP